MLEGKCRVLEVGCSDGYGSRIVRQHVSSLDAMDIDEHAISVAKKNMSARWPIRFFHGDILQRSRPGFDAVYCLDVFEHIKQESRFLSSLRECAQVAIIGTPSLESQKYASKHSLAGHVNCKSGEDFKKSLENHWRQVFVFSMNDEVVHTGFYPMAHYLIGLAVA